MNSRKFYKLVWINLDQIWKRYEGNKKAEKQKGEKRKNRKWPRGNRSARSQKRPTARLPRIPNRYPVPLFSIADMQAPPVSARLSLTSSRISRRWASPSAISSPPSIPSIRCLIHHAPAPIRSPAPPLCFPSFPPNPRAARCSNSCTPRRHCRRQTSAILVSSDHPDPIHLHHSPS
jgi:hypothetical protein